MNGQQSGDFYIGYMEKMPASHAHEVKLFVLSVGLIILATLGVLSAAQGPMQTGAFEFGVSSEFEGVLYESPIPMFGLKKAAGGLPAQSMVVLCGFGKQGLPDFAKDHHGKYVRFKGSLIYCQNMVMIEMHDPDSFEVVDNVERKEYHQQGADFVSTDLVGELIDTKCYLGVMRPALGKVHRGCAVVCLKGGIPPALAVTDETGLQRVVMLAAPEGQSLELAPQLAGRQFRVQGHLGQYDQIQILTVTGWSLLP
jgi:hypothetical protein